MTARAAVPGTPMPPLVQKAQRVLTQERAKVQQEIEQYSQDPRPDCRFLVDRDAWKAAPRHTQRAPWRRLQQGGMQYARLAAVNVLDHLWAVHRLLDAADELPLFAHWSVARVACEAAAKAAHLLDRTADYETRLLRAAVLLRADAAEHLKATRALPASLPVMPDALTRAEQGHAAVHKRIARAGITEVLGRDGTPAKLEMPGHGGRESLILNLTALVERWFPDRTNLYRQTSGVVHSTPWMLTDAVTSTPLEPELKLGPNLFGIGAAVLISVDAADVLSAAYAAYYGHDPAPASRARATRTRAMDVAVEKLVVDRFSPGG